MSNSVSVYDVRESLLTHIRSKHTPKYARSFEHQLDTAINAYWLPGHNPDRFPLQTSMTKAEAAKRREHLKQIPASQLQNGLSEIGLAFDRKQATKTSRYTYTGRFKKLLAEAEKLSKDLPIVGRDNSHNERGPKQKRVKPVSERMRLTDRRRKYRSYKLPQHQLLPEARQELELFGQYYTAEFFPSRWTPRLKPVTVASYIQAIELFYGYFHHHCGVPLEQLNLSWLVPFIPLAELDELTPRQQQQRWRQACQQMETWIAGYVQFMREYSGSQSPRSLNTKFSTLKAACRFLYRSEVDSGEEYVLLLPYRTLSRLSSQASEQSEEWRRDRRYVADQSKKWPDVPPGQTAIEVVRREIVEPLRLEARPRRSNGKILAARPLTERLADYLMWALPTEQPARRSKEYRTAQIALSCPIQRPESVPLGGLYQPLPPRSQREQLSNGSLLGVFFCHLYEYDGVRYPQGQWFLIVFDFKTSKTHGTFVMPVRNRRFDDGRCFSDYIEEYLYGVWLPVHSRFARPYTWWRSDLQGIRGRWVTPGRMELKPLDSCLWPPTEDGEYWSLGYLFIRPKSGMPVPGNGFGRIYTISAYRLLGKQVNPHLLRHMWATWGYQMRLSDDQMHALAYAMGQTITTLRRVYERCTATEKLAPLTEALNRLDGQTAGSRETPPELVEIEAYLDALSPWERQRLMELLSDRMEDSEDGD